MLNSTIQILVPENRYEVHSDNRLLVPFLQEDKVGFMNHDKDVVIQPIYEVVKGDFYNHNDLVIVGIHQHRKREEHNTIIVKNEMTYGVLNSKGQLVVDIDYRMILASDCERYFTVQRFENKKYAVYNRHGEELIPAGTYSWMDGFWKGLARVKRAEKFGIINTKGEIVLPIEFDSIWNFYGKDYPTIVTVKKGQMFQVPFCQLL